MVAPPAPVVTFAYQQSVLKEEDVLLVNPSQQYPADKSSDASSSLRTTELNGFAYRNFESTSASTDDADRPASCGLFVVCDGHNGVTAAQYVADQLPAYLDDLLPPGSPPPESEAKAWLTWRQGLQRALTISLALIHRAFAGMGVLAGCTVTIILQHGWLLTVANLGDSRAVVDTGRDVTVLTADHRVATHKQERRRLEKRGAVIAPVDISGNGPAAGKGAVGVGPLRLWPGGLCLSRAIGDFDVGDTVLSLPHVTQVKLPPQGARLILASDGVWDAFEKTTRVSSIVRSSTTQAAPQRIIKSILFAHDGLKDDTSLVVVDLMPPNKSFPECTRFGSGMCLCLNGKNDPDAPDRPLLEIVEQVDTAELAGVMPELPSSLPTWFTRELTEQLLETHEQAMEIWEQASGMRRTGRIPSIADFEQLLVAARLEKTSVAEASARAAAQDMSVRLGGQAHMLLRGKSMFPQSTSASSLGENPSVRFGNSVALDSEDFANKFGHYGRQPHHTAIPPAAYNGVLPAAQSPSERVDYQQGAVSNPHLMKHGTDAESPPSQQGNAADFSVHAGRGSIDGRPPGPDGQEYSVRLGVNRPYRTAARMKTISCSSVPEKPPAKPSSLLQAGRKSLQRISAGMRRGSGGLDASDASDTDPSTGKHHRQRLPMTELQAATPQQQQPAASEDTDGRVRAGKAAN